MEHYMEHLASNTVEFEIEVVKGVERVVYFVRSADFVKIGMTCDVDTRLSTLRRANPNITLIGIATGGLALERHLHTLFSRYRYYGEWFTACPDILALARQLIDMRDRGLRSTVPCLNSDVAEVAPEQVTLAAATLAAVERSHILATMTAASGNLSVTARLLDIGRNTLLRKLKAYGLRD